MFWNCWESGFKTISVGIITIRRWLRRPTKGYFSWVCECRKANLPKDVGITLYNTKILPLLENVSPVWGGLPNYRSEEVQQVALVLLAYQELPPPVLHERRSTASKRELGKILKEESNPNNVFVKSVSKKHYNLRSGRRTYIEVSGTDRHQRSFIPRAYKLCGM